MWWSCSHPCCARAEVEKSLFAVLRHTGLKCCSSHLTNIASITITTIDLIHNIGLITIRNTVLWMEGGCSREPSTLLLLLLHKINYLTFFFYCSTHFFVSLLHMQKLRKKEICSSSKLAQGDRNITLDCCLLLTLLVHRTGYSSSSQVW